MSILLMNKFNDLLRKAEEAGTPLGLKASEISVYKALLDRANDNGNSIYPSDSTVSIVTGFTRRTIQRAKRQLIKLGKLIEVGTKQKGIKEYMVSTEALDKIDLWQRIESDLTYDINDMKAEDVLSVQRTTPCHTSVDRRTTLCHTIQQGYSNHQVGITVPITETEDCSTELSSPLAWGQAKEMFSRGDYSERVVATIMTDTLQSKSPDDIERLVPEVIWHIKHRKKGFTIQRAFYGAMKMIRDGRWATPNGLQGPISQNLAKTEAQESIVEPVPLESGCDKAPLEEGRRRSSPEFVAAIMANMQAKLGMKIGSQTV